MRPYPILLLSIVSFGALSQSASAQGTRALLPPKVTLTAEEPTGVFFDRDTIAPQTPLLFSARVENPATEPRQIELTWKITDANGQVRFNQDAKFTVAGGDSIVRRELFDAPARGGYLLETTAFTKLKGPDAQVKAALPFAVTVAPSPGANAARPRSFFVLSTPALLTGPQLDFYARLGARVLRSPLPPDPAHPDWSAVESQLGERLKRNLATIALLPLGDDNGRRSEAFFARQVPGMLARYGSLSTWELAGDVSPADLDAWSQVSQSRRNDIALLGPLPSGLPDALPSNASVKINGLEGATFDWPDFTAHPTALRRLWLSRAAATRGAGLPAFHLRRDDEEEANLAGDAAGEMTQDYLSAIMAGASSMSEALSPDLSGNAGASAMARGAAFSMMSRTLEDASFREQLFPNSPAYEGALFRAGRGSIAVMYATRDVGSMVARVSPAKAYDLFGNLISSDNNGALEIPLSGQPIYVVSEVPTDVLSFALRNARIAGIRPLEAQFLPLSRIPGLGTGSTAVRVRLQNIGLGQQSGQLRLDAPKGWKLATDHYDYQLGEGESKTYEFRALVAPVSQKWPLGRVPLQAATSGQTKLKFESLVPVVSALNVTRGDTMRMDGDLGDWSGAIWQEVGPNKGGVSAKVALKWDANHLFIAAQVHETALSPRRVDETSYEFWKGHDALQFAFGTTDGPETVPSREPFRDSDRGFLLSPFNQKGPSDYDGRVLKLWGPDKPYNSVVDRIRWAGAVPGSSCVISRDEQKGMTIYEARLPLSAIPDISPLELAAKDGVVRFGWILHNDEGTALDYGRTQGSFPWWANTSTFLPDGRLTSPLRSTLGFTQNGEVELGLDPTARTSPSAAPPETAPAPAPVAPMSVAPALSGVPPRPATSVAAPVAPPSVVVAPPPVVAPPTTDPDLPPPSKPARRNAPPRQIAPFIVPESNLPQQLPPAAPR